MAASKYSLWTLIITAVLKMIPCHIPYSYMGSPKCIYDSGNMGSDIVWAALRKTSCYIYKQCYITPVSDGCTVESREEEEGSAYYLTPCGIVLRNRKSNFLQPAGHNNHTTDSY